jgi:hypothetical protein
MLPTPSSGSRPPDALRCHTFGDVTGEARRRILGATHNAMRRNIVNGNSKRNKFWCSFCCALKILDHERLFSMMGCRTNKSNKKAIHFSHRSFRDKESKEYISKPILFETRNPNKGKSTEILVDRTCASLALTFVDCCSSCTTFFSSQKN